MNEYPEHIKLKAVQERSQAIHEFVEFLQGKGIHLAEYLENSISDRLVPSGKGLTNLVAEFLDIDMKKLEKEKQHMLDEIRKKQ